jgi:phage I-like protein
MYEKAYQKKNDEYRFLAAIQGVDLPDPEEQRVQEKIDMANAKAAAKLAGISEEEYLHQGMIQFIDEDEE